MENLATLHMTIEFYNHINVRERRIFTLLSRAVEMPFGTQSGIEHSDTHPPLTNRYLVIEFERVLWSPPCFTYS